MKKKITLISALVLIVIMIMATMSSASSSVSSKPGKDGYYTISTSTKLKVSSNTKITLPISFSKNPVVSKTFTKSGKSVSAIITISGKTLSVTPKSALTPKASYLLKLITKNKKKYTLTLTSMALPTPTPTPTPTPDPWKLVYNETFDKPFNEPTEWTEDTYAPDSKYYADAAFGDNGNYFIGKGQSFTNSLNSFKSFRKTYTYGENGWLTVELYGRDSNKDGEPETGGKFVATADGKAKLISTNYTDGAIIRSTDALPAKYKIELTASNINFGGSRNGSWQYDGKNNGYDNVGGTSAGPWDSGSAVAENGLYFLCITDYANPAPHNNIFIHHHRKFVIDTDNNNDKGSAWSYIWDPKKGYAVMDGSHYLNLVWLNGDYFGSDNNGNDFISWAGGQWFNSPTFTDAYKENQSYTFTLIRDLNSYTASMTGTFYYGGKRTYTATRKFTDPSGVTWHYNQTPQELTITPNNQTKTYNGQSFQTWPKDSAYPDYFFFGDPHINYYEGTAEFDDVKLYLPK